LVLTGGDGELGGQGAVKTFHQPITLGMERAGVIFVLLAPSHLQTSLKIWASKICPWTLSSSAGTPKWAKCPPPAPECHRNGTLVWHRTHIRSHTNNSHVVTSHCDVGSMLNSFQSLLEKGLAFTVGGARCVKPVTCVPLCLPCLEPLSLLCNEDSSLCCLPCVPLQEYWSFFGR